MNFPLISIITINYNGLDDTCAMLKSLEALTYPNFEIIVVDNGSTHDPSEIISSQFPEVTMVRSEKNLGFTGGNNLGIKLANGNYYFLLNNDTIIYSTDLLEELITPLLEKKEVGMSSPKIRYHDHPDIIQFAGYEKINPVTGRNKQIGDREIDKGQYDSPCYTHYAMGAALMVKREVIDQIGLMHDLFFLCYEELDWSSQAVKSGFKIFFQPKAIIYHKESMSLGKVSAVKTYYNTRNRILFMRRNSSVIERFLFYCYCTLFTIPKNTASFLLKGQFQYLRAFFCVILWNLSHTNLYSRHDFRFRLKDVRVPDGLQVYSPKENTKTV